jgi:predicted  nucleic acid-binding Zn-ribbon protein
MAEKQLNEEKTAAASYVLTFYTEVQQLTNTYANYENLLLQLQEKYGKDLSKTDEIEKEQIKTACQMLRYYVNLTYIKYASIAAKTKEKSDIDIKKLYEQLKSNYIVDLQEIHKYVIKLNGVLMNTVIKTLLESSADIVNKIYD